MFKLYVSLIDTFLKFLQGKSCIPECPLLDQSDKPDNDDRERQMRIAEFQV